MEKLSTNKPIIPKTIFLFIGLFAMFLFLIYRCPPEPDPNTKEGVDILLSRSTTRNYDLVQLQNRIEHVVSGSYALFFGSIDSEDNPYYIFYIKNTDGAISLKKVDSYKVTIYETSGTPSASEVQEMLFESPSRRENAWILFLPPGSIVNNIDANLPIN